MTLTTAQTATAGSNPQRSVQRVVPASPQRAQGRTATERAADSTGSTAPVTVAQDLDVSARLIRTHASIPADDALRSLAGAEEPRRAAAIPEEAADTGSEPNAAAPSHTLARKGTPYGEQPVRTPLLDVRA